MDKNDIDLIVDQIRHILLGKQIPSDMYVFDEDLAELQSAVRFLEECLKDANEFLIELTLGKLEVAPPESYNFFIGNLKELHASLRHLTWQANQVANGDYSQSVHFLGDFSNSFNEMISQLSFRERKLKEQSSILLETVDLLKSIMDGLEDWIIVTHAETNDFIYINKSAKSMFYNNKGNLHSCGESCALKMFLREFNIGNSPNMEYEYYCVKTKNIFLAQSHLIQWNDNLAFAHFITNITDEKNFKAILTEKAYLDELTELGNRRYCMEKIEKLLIHKKPFSISLLDVDGLKFANDAFGHQSGDIYLKKVAKKMKSVFRNEDIVARIGGDEFVVISEMIKEYEMDRRIKYIDESLVMESKEYPMSVSHGTISVDENNQLTSKEILELVDEKMYINKKQRKKERLN